MTDRTRLLGLFATLLALVLLCPSGLRSQTRYYVDNVLGSDQNTGRSESSAWSTIARVNRQTLSPGDQVLFRSGQVWREQVVMSSSGSSSSPIVLSYYGIGPHPVINGADVLVSGWVDRGRNVWKIGCSPPSGAPRKVFFDSTTGAMVLSVDMVNASHQWCWVADTLYVYSNSNPATAYSSPGIEVPLRYGIVLGPSSFITIDGIDVTKSFSGAIWATNPGAHDLMIRNLSLYDNGGSGTYCNASRSSFVNVISHNNGWNRFDHGFYLDADGMLVEHCTAYNNAGAGIDVQNGTDTVRYCLTYGNGTRQLVDGLSDGGFGIVAQTAAGQTITAYYNIVRDNYKNGLWAGWCSGGRVNFWNNVVTRTAAGSGAGFYGANNDPSSIIELQNNIFYEDSTECVSTYGSMTPYRMDHNLYFKTSGVIASWNGVGYSVSRFAGYQSASGQEAHGLFGNPGFVDAPSGDFSLTKGSPCVDAGIDVGLRLDAGGVNVPQGAGPDIGAFEFLVPQTPRIDTPRMGSQLDSLPVKVAWSSPQNSPSYEFQMSTDSLFAQSVLDTTVHSTTLWLDTLQSYRKYYIRVKAISTQGTSPCSQPSYFSTGNLNKTVVIQSPSIDTPRMGIQVDSLPVNVAWSSPQSSPSYEFQMSTDSLFAQCLVDTTADSTAVWLGTLQSNRKYYIRVKAISTQGTSPYSQPTYFLTGNLNKSTPKGDEVPRDFYLNQNYPNPFNPSTLIEFAIPSPGYTELVVYSLSGAEITRLVSSHLASGKYRVRWDASKFASGVYFCRLASLSFTDVIKLIVVK